MVSEGEASDLFDTFAVRASGVPLFQAATVNVTPGTEAEVDTGNPDRCRSSTAKDHTAPWAIVNASYQRQKRDPA